METMHKNESLNSIIINLYFLPTSSYELKYKKESRKNKFFPECLV